MKAFIVFTICFVQGVFLSAQNTMKTASYTVVPAEEWTVAIEVENMQPFVAFQVDIPLPENFVYINGSAQLNAARTNGHLLSASLQAGNVLRLLGYSVENAAFTGNSGTVVAFSLKAGTAPGVFLLTLDKALIGDSESNNILTSVQNGSITLLAPNIALSTPALDFDRVALQSVSERNIQIGNAGNSLLIINHLTVSNSRFSVSETLPLTIAPQTNRNIVVRFTPTGKGTVSEQLLVSSNDPDRGALAVPLNAVAYAVNELHTGDISGASGSTQTLEFSVNNMEAFTGFQFDVILPQAMTYVAHSEVLFRKADHTVSVNPIGDHRLRVLAFSIGNAAFIGNEGKVIALDFALQGIADYYPVTIDNVILVHPSSENILSNSYNGTLQITSPDIAANRSIPFGDVSIVSGKEMNHRIYNYGQEPLEISQFRFSSEYFSSAQTLPLTILPNQYADVPIRFAKTTKGTADGEWTIFSNDPDENPFTVHLTANAYAPNILKVHPQTITAETTGTEITVEIENEEDFVAFQFDLTYPAGLIPDTESIALSNRKEDHTVSANILPDNVLRIVAFSLSQKPFRDKSGAVVQLPFTLETPLPIGSYHLSLSDATLSNAQSENILWDVENGVLTVNKIVQTLVLDVIPDKTYGDAAFTLNAQISSDLPVVYTSSDPDRLVISGNRATILGTGNFTVTATQDGNNNYLPTSDSQTFEVSKATLTVSAENKVRFYGDGNPTLTYTFSDFVNGDTPDDLQTLPTIACAAELTSPAGDYPITISGAADDNYRFTYQDAQLTINKASLTVKSNNATRKYGESNPEFTLSYSGFKNDEDESVLDELPLITCLADETSPAGFYDIVLSGGSDNNYGYELVNGKLEVKGLVGLVETRSHALLRVYPNPVKDDLHIQSDVPVKRIEMFDLSGRTVGVQSNLSLQSGMQTVDMSALPAGMYFVRIYTGSSCATEKLRVNE